MHSLVVIVLLHATALGADPPRLAIQKLEVTDFRPIEGPTAPEAVYYRVVDDDGPMLRSSYRPDQATVTMGVEIPKELRNRIARVRWRWRVRTFPQEGNECMGGAHSDSAASTFIAWKRGLKWYVLKYSWSTIGTPGQVCDKKRTLLLVRDTILLESDGRPGTWHTEIVDVRRAFIDHFARGDPHADIPDLVGIGLMTDGDQSHSESGADWTGFEVQYPAE